jgi:tRNA (mo5U34)-methyltransferase
MSGFAPTPAEIDKLGWYHTLELPGGIVTPGLYDLRRVPARIQFPKSLAGKRCLDVGTRDGFWAFEMERRGAEEVLAIDLFDQAQLDWPDPGSTLTPDAIALLEGRWGAFDCAREMLGSRVTRQDLSIYDLAPELVGEFDFVYLGTLLLHLRDPIGALAAVRRVTRGELLVNDTVSLWLTLIARHQPRAELMAIGDPFWWVLNIAGLRRVVTAAGFEITATGRLNFVANGAAADTGKPRGLRPRLDHQVLRRLGVPHSWVRARPGRG